MSTKIEFRHRRVTQLADVTDLVEMLFPGNHNQQHAAARILLELKWADTIVTSLGLLEDKYAISRRTLQRTRAKLVHMGLIERISWMNSRYDGQEGWKLSGRMSTGLRQLADKIDEWRKDRQLDRREKEEALVDVIQS